MTDREVDRPHIVDGLFQSDKYPTTPPGKVPLSVDDPMAQDLLWEYAQRRRTVDEAFAEDLAWALRNAGYEPPTDSEPTAKRVAATLAMVAGETKALASGFQAAVVFAETMRQEIDVFRTQLDTLRAQIEALMKRGT